MARVRRIAGFSAGFLIFAALVVWLAGPRVAGSLGRQKLLDELARRGISAEMTSLRVSPTGAVANGLCLFDPPPNQSVRMACFDRVEVSFGAGGPLRGDTMPSGIAVVGGVVYGNLESGALIGRIEAWRNHLDAQRRAPRDGDASTGTTRERAPLAPIEVLITNLDVQVAGQQGLPLSGAMLERVEATVSGATSTVEAHIVLRDATLPGPLTGEIPAVWDISLQLEDFAPTQLQIHPETALVVSAPALLPGLRLSLDGGGVSWPYHITVFGLDIREEGATNPLLAWATATLSLREFTTNIEELYFTSLEVSAPRVFVALDDAGAPVLPAALQALVGSAANAGPETAEGSGEAPAEAEVVEGSGEVTPAPAVAEASGGLWSGREWWEKFPQRITVRDAEIHVSRADGSEPPVVAKLETIEYALRIFNFQLDVTIRGALEAAGVNAGNVALQLIWGWESSNLGFDLNVENLALAPLGALMCRGDCVAPTGLLDVAAEFSEADRGPGMNFSGSIALRDATLPIPLLQNPLSVASMRYTWEASRSRDVEPVALRFTTGDLELGEARMSVRPTLHTFRYDRNPPLSSVDLRIEVPEQPAQAIFDAVPPELLGPLVGTRMTGTFGYGIEFSVFVEQNEAGTNTIRISEPSWLERSDASLALEFLPDTVDVRRMLGPFTFTFHGPENSVNRVIRVPGPPGNNADGAEGVAGEGDAAMPLDTHSWTRLREISWFLIATQLYREDGRFFSNSGINWYQLRQVVAEAYTERRLGRGASTITMQLVKNVLLSHERSVERKIQELFLTYWTTRLVPKDRILEIYLNVIEWGPNVNGITEAADHYFNTSPAELTIGEAVWLSAITPAPQRRASQRAMGTPPEWMRRQMSDLMSGLAQRGWISDAELARGLADEVQFVGARTTIDASVLAAESIATGKPNLSVAPTTTDAPATSADGILAVAPEERLSLFIEQSQAGRLRR